MNKSRPSHGFANHPEYPDFIARYISTRPYAPSNHWNTHFPVLLNAIVDELVRRRLFPHQSRTTMLTTLCKVSPLDHISSKTIGPGFSPYPFEHHLFLAAAHTHHLALISPFLAQTPNLKSVDSEFLGPPLRAAIATHDIALITLFLARGAPIEYPGWLLDVVRVADAPSLLTLLTTRQERQLVLHTSFRDVRAAILLAVELGKEEVAILLLETQREMFTHGSLAYYLRGVLLGACERGMGELVLKVVEAGGYVRGEKWIGPSLKALLGAACKAGRASVLRVLLGRTDGLKDGMKAGDLLLQCAETGTLETLRVLLECGAKLSGVEAMKLLASVAPWPDTVDEDTSSVLRRTCYLLEYRAVNIQELLGVEKHTGFGVAHSMVVAAQRGNFALLEALARFGVPVDDVEFYAKAGCPVPLVAAEAYGREETADKIKLLAVELALETIVV